MIEGLKPYADYKESGLPWLAKAPSHWVTKRGKSYLTCIDKRSAAGKEDLLTVSSARGVVPRDTAKVTMFKAESYAGHKLCWPGDLVINSLWAWGGGLGVAQHHGIVSTAYSVYRSRPSAKINPRFLHEFVRSSAFNWELHVRSKGVWISRLQLTDTAFLDAPIPLPPPDEQAAIVRFLDHANRKIDGFIRAKRKLIGLLNEQKQAIIHRAVTRGLNPDAPLKPSGIPWLGEIPEHWEVLALKRVLRRLIDCEHKTAPATENSELRVVRTTGIRNGRLRFHGTYGTTSEAFKQWTRRGLPEAGDVLFTREAPAGEACVMPEGITLCMGQRTVLMKLRAKRINAHFLVHSIYGGPPRTAITLASQGSTVGHFNMADIGAMTVFLPPLAEQEEIVAAIEHNTEPLTTAIARTEREIALMQEYRTRLTADIVTGKLDVREAAAKLPEVPLETFDPPEGDEPSDDMEPEEEMD